ncbi:PDZ domain-containing protein [Olivibacter sp. CPCC 100613]|uniref:PDZ domain-containing protein n=1 Tax=Olivibacter sp. CPCC 100613 TaxID=3079931 RepID=UPI002FF887F4
MKNRYQKLFFVLLIGLLSFNSFGQTRQFYVSMDGNNTNNGSAEQPLRTPNAAKEHALALRRSGYKGRIELIVRAGNYYLDQPLVFTPEESGSTEQPYIIKAQNNDLVYFNAGQYLSLQWEPHTKTIWKAKVPEGVQIESLFANHEPKIRARYPNYDASILPFHGYAPDAIDPQRVKTWKNPIGAYVHALHQGRWGGFHYQVTEKKPDGTLILEGGKQNNRPSEMHATYRFIENVFEELDSPEEWYFDKNERILYYFPKKGENIHHLVFEAAKLENIITLLGHEKQPVHDISIEGIRFINTRPTFMKTAEPLLRSDWTIYRQGAIKIEGAVHCQIVNNKFYHLGGNALFLSNYNRAITITDNLIEDIGAGAINVVGNPQAVRSPSFRYEDFVPADQMDLAPGPQSNDYPAGCIIQDNLIRHIGLIEKQVAGVQLSMASEIKVIHNTIYDVPRAGINIGDGTWGGHVIAFNDVYRTVLETSDHGAFNSWGRDRFWHPNRKIMDSITAVHPNWVLLDAIRPTQIHDNRFQCDHGWDIDLDDGSTNYEIFNNLCLSGGLKLREGFHRKVYHNILLNNGFHPHVWFKDSHDIFRDNLVMRPHQDIQIQFWGDTVDYNLYMTQADLKADQAKGIESHGKVLDTNVIKVLDGTLKPSGTIPAWFAQLNFPEVGVRSPLLKRLVEKQAIPRLHLSKTPHTQKTFRWQQATLKNIETLGEQSAAGLPGISGILVAGIERTSPLLNKGLLVGDVIIGCNGKKVDTFQTFEQIINEATPKHVLKLTIFRNQRQQVLTIQNN